MLRQIITTIYALLFLVFACNPVQEKASIKEARQIHEEISKIDAQLNEKLKTLIQKKNSINIQGRMLNEKELAFIDQIESLESDYLDWKNQFKQSTADIETQAAESQASSQPVSARKMLDTQETLKAKILEIKKNIDGAYNALVKDDTLNSTASVGKVNL